MQTLRDDRRGAGDEARPAPPTRRPRCCAPSPSARGAGAARRDRAPGAAPPAAGRATPTPSASARSSTFDPERRARAATYGSGASPKSSSRTTSARSTAYERAVEQAGDQPELLEALDRLYARLGENARRSRRFSSGAWPSSSSDAGAGRALLPARRSLQIESFKEPARGSGSLRMALERAQDHEAAVDELEKLTEQRDLFEEAAEVLEAVYRARGRTDRLAKLYEKRVGFADSPEERIDMRRNLARVLEDEAKIRRAAQRVLQQGLAEHRPTARCSTRSSAWRPSPATGQGAASAARRHREARTTSRPSRPWRCRCGSPLAAATRRATQRAAEAALEARARLRARSATRCSCSIEQLAARARAASAISCATLRRRAKLQLDEERREELYRQAQGAGRSASAIASSAESVLRELLAQDDANLWALAEL